MQLQTGVLLGKLAECIGDTDKAVRGALKELLSTAVLPQLKGAMLGPFVPLVMAHLFSALTSLSEAIRSAPCILHVVPHGANCSMPAGHHAVQDMLAAAFDLQELANAFMMLCHAITCLFCATTLLLRMSTRQNVCSVLSKPSCIWAP